MHKTFTNEASFPSSESKRTKSSLPGKLNITKNIGEATEYNNFHVWKMTCLGASDEHNAVTAFGGGCCCLGTQSCQTIIQKYLDDRLSSGFRMIITTYRCCERDRSSYPVS